MNNERVTIKKGYACYKKPEGVRAITLQAFGPKGFGFMRIAPSYGMAPPPALKHVVAFLYKLSEEELQVMLPGLYAAHGLDRSEWEETIASDGEGKLAFFAHAKNDAPWLPIPSELQVDEPSSAGNLAGFIHALRGEAASGKVEVQFNPHSLAEFLEGAADRLSWQAKSSRCAPAASQVVE